MFHQAIMRAESVHGLLCNATLVASLFASWLQKLFVPDCWLHGVRERRFLLMPKEALD